MPDRTAEVQTFRAAQRATRVHILTLITPFSATLDRFLLVETAAGATLRRCIGCRLSAPLDQGESDPVTPEALDRFLHGIDNAAWESDDVPESALDGLTIIVERATESGYDITHMVNPRGTSPHARLLRAWTDAFPAVNRALR